MSDDEISLWLITKGTMEDKPTMALAADRLLTLRAERDRLRHAIMFWLEAEEPDVDAAINMMRAALKGETP